MEHTEKTGMMEIFETLKAVKKDFVREYQSPTNITGTTLYYLALKPC